MKKILFAAMICLFVLQTQPAMAELSAQSFLENLKKSKKPDKSALAYFFRGNTNGISWMQSYLNSKYKKTKVKIYCPPRKRVLKYKEYVGIFRKYLNKKPKMKDKPLGMVIMLSLIDAFPCRR